MPTLSLISFSTLRCLEAAEVGNGTEWTVSQSKAVQASWTGLKRPHTCVMLSLGVVGEIRGVITGDSRTLASPSRGDVRLEPQAKAKE